MSVEVTPMPVPGAVPAPLSRRLLSFVIDAVAVVLVGGAFVVAGVVEVVTATAEGAEPGPSPLALVGVGMLVVLGLAQWRLLARQGRTIGRLLTGIRLVRVPDGRVPGAGRALVRLVLPVLAWLVPVLGPLVLHLSPLADVRRRGWHDKAAGLMAVDLVAGVDPTLAVVAGRRLDDVLRPRAARTSDVPAPAAAAGGPAAMPPTAMPPLPAPRPASEQAAVEPVVAVPWQVRREEQTTPGPLVDSASLRDVLVRPDPALAEPGLPEPAVVSALPQGILRPSSALLDLEDTAGGAVARHVARPSSGSDEPASGDVPDADGGLDVTDTLGRPVTRVVPDAAVPVHTSTPFASTQAEEDVESTRLRPARGKVPELAESRGPAVTVELTDGQRIAVTGTALVGRDPSPRPGEEADQLIRVADPGRSVSKTHLRIGVDRGNLWVTDRDSTNGTVVTLADGQQILCGAEQQVRLPAGATVAFGDYGLNVVTTDA